MADFTEADLEALRKQLIVHEGVRLKPYTCPAGKLTIGIGRNLEDNGITAGEALAMLNHDINETILELSWTFPWFDGLDSVRQRVMVDLAFNMGLPRLQTFTKMLAAMAKGDSLTAANELRASKWYTQVQPSRAKRLVSMLESGQA